MTPPIDLRENFVAAPADLWLSLQQQVIWDGRMRSRRTASYGVAYNYSQIAYPDTPMLESLVPLCSAIEATLGFRPNNCLINDYPDGQSSMGWHEDDISLMASGAGVAILSLGATRRMTFRLTRDRTRQHAVDLPAGSLLYLPDSMQADWQHAIPPAADTGARTSLSFRKLA